MMKLARLRKLLQRMVLTRQALVLAGKAINNSFTKETPVGILASWAESCSRDASAVLG